MAENKKKIEAVDDGKEEVYIPRGGAGTEEQLVVGINGVLTIIPKGVRVRVPGPVAEEVRRATAAQDAADRRKLQIIEEAAAAGK